HDNATARQPIDQRWRNGCAQLNSERFTRSPEVPSGLIVLMQQVRSSNSSMKDNKLAMTHEQPVKNSAPPL
ncbi:TPA: hypothetical protein ACKROS_004423, partial [Pseudomonas aeruginosa]